MSIGTGRGHAAATLGVIRGTDATERERFLTVLSRPPLRQADAIVVLCGEDGAERAEVGMHLLGAGYAPRIILSGGLEAPPLVGAWTLHARLMGKGVDPSRLVVEADSTNTHEQAVNVLALPQVSNWTSLLLVASPQHLPRAFLTFLRALQDADAVRVTPVPASQLRWWSAPEGTRVPRITLLDEELAKIARYPEHVATYAEGLAYLEHWERATPAVPAKQ